MQGNASFINYLVSAENKNMALKTKSPAADSTMFDGSPSKEFMA